MSRNPSAMRCKMAAKETENSPAPVESFEDALAQLEAIVRELEEGQVPLALGLARYEEGVKLLKQCYQQLEHVERRIELLNRVDPEGNAQCEPFDDSALSLEEKARARGQRRSRAADSDEPQTEDEMDGPGRLF
jgi:exodeoxyribonuclease VII small subunit